MPSGASSDLTAIVGTVALLFHRLRAVGDDMHRQRGITAPMRGVMLSLADGTPRTVPELAAARPVSRQHIQSQVDALIALGLARSLPNPMHKRSHHIALTDRGRRQLAAMLSEEAKVLEKLQRLFSADDLAATRRTLSTLAGALAELISTSKETTNDQ